VLYSGVTRSTDKQTIVDLHNNLRRQVAQGTESRGNPGPQPSAANMRKIVSRVLKTPMDANIYSAVHGSWPVEKSAGLADEPSRRGEVAKGGCLFAWNFVMTRCNCTYGGEEIDTRASMTLSLH
jgi:hypothetical protein